MSPTTMSSRSGRNPGPGSPNKNNTITPSTAASPGRKKGGVRLASDRRKKPTPGKTNPTLYCYATDPLFPLEIYLYTANGDNDGFTNNFRKYTKGEITCNTLEDANFTDIKYRRIPLSENLIMTDGKGFWRSVLIRTLTTGTSTEETRKEGLAVLKAFFLDKKFTDYPPVDINCLDASDPKDPQPLDHFLQDHDIVSIIEEHVDESHLNQDFYSKFEACAKKIWEGPNYPAYAFSTLGFPKTS